MHDSLRTNITDQKPGSATTKARYLPKTIAPKSAKAIPVKGPAFHRRRCSNHGTGA